VCKQSAALRMGQRQDTLHSLAALAAVAAAVAAAVPEELHRWNSHNSPP